MISKTLNYPNKKGVYTRLRAINLWNINDICKANEHQINNLHSI
jgi:hypothetical protein